MTAAPDAAPSPKISPQAFEKARLCVQAALMRQERKSFTVIASELGLPAGQMHQVVKVGVKMISESMPGGPVTEIPDDEARAAAQFRAKHMSFAEIAEKLGLPSADEAKRAVMAGLGLPLHENLEALRDETATELAHLADGLWQAVDNPGPLVTESGKVVIDERTGEPYPDQGARLKAMGTLLGVYRTLRGLLAKPAYGTLDDLRAEIERRKQELGEAADGGDP